MKSERLIEIGASIRSSIDKSITPDPDTLTPSAGETVSPGNGSGSPDLRAAAQAVVDHSAGYHIDTDCDVSLNSHFIDLRAALEEADLG